MAAWAAAGRFADSPLTASTVAASAGVFVKDPQNKSGRRGRGEAEKPGEKRRQRASGGENGHGRQVDPEPALVEGGEEARAGMETDGVDEQDEADDVNMLGEGEARVEGADGDADEEHGHDAQVEAGDLDASGKVAEADHGEEQEERVPREKVDHRLHAVLTSSRISSWSYRSPCRMDNLPTVITEARPSVNSGAGISSSGDPERAA